MVATRGVAGENSGVKPHPPALPARETACNWVICPLQLSKIHPPAVFLEGWRQVGRQVGSNSRPEDSLRLAATSLSKEAKGAPSYLQQAGSGDEATPLPTAQPQEAVALLVLPHADLQRGRRSGGGRGWEERVTFRCE